MKPIFLVLLTITSVIAGLVLNIFIPFPIMRVSPQSAGATITIDYMRTAKPGFITVYASEFGNLSDEQIGFLRIEPGEYRKLSLPVKIVSPLTAKNDVFIIFDEDRDENNDLDESDIINPYIRHVFFTKKISRQ